MKDENVRVLQKLQTTCKNAGILPIFLGLLVVFIDIINKDPMHIFVGMLIFINGYALVKISTKLQKILYDEGVLED